MKPVKAVDMRDEEILSANKIVQLAIAGNVDLAKQMVYSGLAKWSDVVFEAKQQALALTRRYYGRYDMQVQNEISCKVAYIGMLLGFRKEDGAERVISMVLWAMWRHAGFVVPLEVLNSGDLDWSIETPSISKEHPGYRLDMPGILIEDRMRRIATIKLPYTFVNSYDDVFYHVTKSGIAKVEIKPVKKISKVK